MGYPTPSTEYNRVPDGHDFATTVSSDMVVDLTTIAMDVSAGDIIDFQSGLANRIVENVIVRHGKGGSPIGGGDPVRSVRIELGAYVETDTHPVAGDDTVALHISCFQSGAVSDRAIIERNNYNERHEFTYGDVLDIESTDSKEADFVVDWRVIPECINTRYAHPQARDDIPHGITTRKKSSREFFDYWAENTTKETIIDSHWWVNKEVDSRMSTLSPLMLVPILYSDGIICLQDMATDRQFGFIDISQTIDNFHDTAIEHIDSELRGEFLAGSRR